MLAPGSAAFWAKAWCAAASGTPRMASSCNKVASSACANALSHSSSRSRISPAAFLVNVMARISCGRTSASGDSSSARTMRDTSIQVLPAPAQASTATLRRGSQAMA